MEDARRTLEREWEEHCRNTSNQVLVEMNDFGASKMAWMLSRVASTVIIPKRESIEGLRLQSEMIRLLMECVDEINKYR
jgi:hypothetical protein